jgi:FMN phosphatase YigB (HAD superfamily)
VLFDIGETLVDETRWWSDWADYLGVSRLALMAVLGAVIERGEDHMETFRIVRPDLDFDAVWAQRLDDGYVDLAPSDFYADALPCLDRLKHEGFLVGVAGNQSWIDEMIRAQTKVDFVFTANSLGVAKPAPAFFDRLVSACDLPAGAIAYVGDRLDNDVGPSGAAGMVPVWLRRGPWAFVQQAKGGPPGDVVTIDSLDELPSALPL